ncbi:MAG: DUF6268 family outer membrane beta-barrel protein [Opitutaceae bacterium]|nr:DUF6268 family outer membrane beta-barrel protein [Opitutaceae bacterium]
MLALISASPALRAAAPLEPESPVVALRATVAGSGDVRLAGGGQKFSAMRTEEIGLRADYSPLKVGGAALGFSAFVQRTDFNQDRKPWTLPLPERFQSAGVEFSYEEQFGAGWQGLLQISPSWRTAGGSRLVARSFGVTVTTLAVHEFSPALRFALGASADSLAEGSNRLVPVAGLDWAFAPQWRLALGLPRTGVFFTPTPALEFGLVAEGTWTTYYVARSGAAQRLADLRLTDTKIEYTEARAGLQAKWRASSHVDLGLTVGVVGLRQFEYPDRQRKLKSSGEAGGYASVELGFAF